MMTTTTTTSAAAAGTTNSEMSCQEFVQNAWKKDLCSNCFKLKVDHKNSVEETRQQLNNQTTSNGVIVNGPDGGRGGDTTVAPSDNNGPSPRCSSSSVNATNDVNNSNNNNNKGRHLYVKNGGTNWSTSQRKIGSNGAMLWEVGHVEKNGSNLSRCNDDSDSSQSTDYETNGANKVQGIIKEDCGGTMTTTTNGTKTLLQPPILIPKANTSDRRGSVGFTDGSPQVIGYGGNDYEWDDQESSDELSDVDSLENFDLTEEDKAFMQLTDINTEFNADNSNLLNETLLMQHSAAAAATAAAASSANNVTTQQLSSVLLATKFTGLNFYSMPSKVVSRLPTVNPDSPSDAIECETPPQPPLSPPPTSIPTSSSTNAQEFIRSNLYSSSPVSTSDTDDFLDDESSEVSTVIEKRGSLKEDTEDELTMPTVSGSRAGFQSVPIRKISSSPSRASVQQLFKEEPVTAGERQAAAENSLPITKNGQSPRKSPSSSNNGWAANPHGCIPYGISNVLTKENDFDHMNSAPKIPSCPPPASNDESQKFPLQSKHRTKSHSNEETSSVRESSIESHNATGRVSSDNTQSPPFNNDENPLRNRGSSSSSRSESKNKEYAAINHSCHYASSSVRNGSSRSGHNKPNDTSLPIQLPPTPLTNPYSSTAILKGVPSDTTKSSPQKPLVTKPKPKLPAKPLLSPKHSGSTPTSPTKSEAPQSPDNSKSANEITITKIAANKSPTTEQNTTNGYRTSVLYHEISEDIIVHDHSEHSVPSATKDDDVTDACNTSFESKVSNLANALDFNRKITKRKAPKPPQGSTSTPDASPSPHQQKQRHDNSDPVVLRKHNTTYSPQSPANNELSLNGSPSPSPAKSSSTNFHCLAENRTSTSSLESYSSKTTTSSPPSINGQDNNPHHVYKETKSKKSRFSLKKLLKFGKDDHHHDDMKGHKGSKSFQIEERKGKLEIIHPTDLIQNNRSERQENGQIGITTTTDVIVTSDNLSTSRNGNEVRDLNDVTDNSRWAANQEIPSEPPSKSNSEEDTNNVKPPPPPRSRNGGDQDTVKEKPVRPPPPSKQPQHQQQQHRNETSSRLSDDTWQKSNPRNQEGTNSDSRNLDRDKRNSFYGSSMEYANLGDIRNSFVPKKPGRGCTSSMIDITSSEELTKCSNLSTSQEVLHSFSCERRQYVRGQSEDVTYYAPTAEETWETDDIDDLYVDQSAVTSSEPSQPSSFTSDSLSSNSTSTSKVAGSIEGDTRQPCSRTTENLLNDGSGGKVYERVVLKKGNLEKVYAKLPIVSPSGTESSSGSGSSSSCILADVDESSEVGVWPRRKSSRLSLRKAKSVVHKNLEDNYGAVVSANLQTLTQILEQVSMSQHTTTSKVKLLEDVPLYWNDFTLLEDSRVTVIGHMAFYSAIWQQNLEVTLMVTEECPSAAHQSVRNPCALIPIAEFEDHIPSSLLSRHNVDSDDKLCRGTIWVMERTRVETLESVADSLHLQAETDMDGYEREVCFVLLQLINGLKHLQVLGIEEVDGRMDDFLLIMKNNDTNYRFVILSKGSDISSATDGPSQKKLSLCQCALAVMLLLLRVTNPVQLMLNGDLRLEHLKFLSSRHAFKLIGDILRQERATSLSQAKLLIEYMIWGPTDLSFDVQSSVVDCCGNDDEKAYQRWLDLERATVLNNLIRTQSLWQIRLTVFEEYMLSFLVRTCAKTLHEAAAQLQVIHK